MPYIRHDDGTPRYIGEGSFRQRMVDDPGRAAEMRAYNERIRLERREAAMGDPLRTAPRRPVNPTVGGINDFYQEYRNSLKEQAMAKSEPLPVLTFPIIPETDVDGVKRLYKTRYNELEKKYAELHNHLSKAKAATDFYMSGYNKAKEQLQELHMKVMNLEASNVDSAVVVKRMNQVIAELSLPVHNQIGTMSEKLDAFFGALMSRIRCDVEQDELAD